MKLLNKDYQSSVLTQIKSVKKEDSGELVIEGYANTVAKDRAGDVIPASAWQTENALTNYLKNPIILAYHDHSRPIGKMIDYEVDGTGFKIKARISEGAGNVYKLIKDGVLSTFSVGFRIMDADYDSTHDIFLIKDLELTEVSVVSVPCNQDSVFSVAKGMEGPEYETFKKEFIKEKTPMSDGVNKGKDFDIEAFKAEMLGAAGTAAAKAIADAEQAKAEKAAKEKADADARKEAEDRVKAAARKEAESLVTELKTEMNKNAEGFAELLKAKEEQIVSLKDEIAAIAAARSKPVAIGKSVRGALAGVVDAQEVDNVVMLGMVKKTGMFDTDYGKQHIKAVNASSSIQVSSDAYETEFSTNLMRDIQAQLVVAPLFREITMTSANLTIPINPDRGNATWVDSADYGTDNSTGGEITVALTERTLKTFKLAAKTFITEETQEDAILPLLPILRQHLVEAHANEIDNAFLNGNGTGKPKGLITQAAAATKAIASTATHTGTVKVTAKMILAVRRELGLYGVKLNELALVVSQDAYWDLLEDDEWGDVQLVGNNAIKLQGEVGNIYGMPVLVSNQFPAKAASTAYAVLVNKTNFVVARQRGATVRSDFDVEKDRRVFVATQRLNLEPLIETSAGSGNGKGLATVTYAA